jgi:hypothetical protein
MDLVFLIVTRYLQSLFHSGDASSADEFLANHQHLLLSIEADVSNGKKDANRAAELKKFSEDAILALPEKMKRNYEVYNSFCNLIVEPLLSEPYEFHPPTDWDLSEQCNE